MEPGDTPRYGVGANIENHPQVTDYVPRRYRGIALVVCLGLAVGMVAEAAARFAPKWAHQLQVVSAEEIETVLADNLLAWASAATLLAVAVVARLVLLLRRHRVDDYRGRYRIWRTAAWVAVALSINAVVSAHVLVAQALRHVTGWHLLSNSAGWWLIPAAVLGGWLLAKLVVDVAECRTALTAYLLAVVCFGLGAAVHSGWSPPAVAEWLDTLARLLPLGGNLLLLAGTLLYARYVVLDVQGLVEHAEPVVSPPEQSAHDEQTETAAQTEPKPQQAQTEQESPGEPETWDYADEWAALEEEDRNHKKEKRLSKAERKRLRKQRGRDRAA